MRRFKHLGIGTRLAIAFATVLCLTLALAGFAVQQLAQVRATAAEVDQRWVPALRLSSAVNTLIVSIKMTTQHHVMTPMADAKAAAAQQLRTLATSLARQRAELQALPADPDARSRMAEFAAAWTAYLAAQRQILALSDQYSTDEALALATGPAQRHFATAEQALTALVDLNARGVQQAGRTSEAVFDAARTGIALALLLILGLGSAASVVTTRSITRPIRAAVQVAQTVAAGDLSSRIEPDTRDETGQLLAALREMNSGLVDIVRQVRSSSDSIATGSAEIASGNADLSQRTERQAAQLQHTASSMAQMTSTVHANADTAREANQLASHASSAAARGGEVVGRVVGTMQDISASSRRIADIIGVIDGIAFQTNILALNAAVEAARAGEQGRGFAVVAGEVRGLAQRSALAAREIKGLIGESVEKVETGTRLVDEAGRSMTEIVAQVQRVGDLIARISTASAEQASGIGQVGEAVQQIDQSTQQNAALVEQSAAAADSLRQQAARLTDVVGAFRLA
jgi:methyl-accepting chemotaxis protein